MKIMVAIPCYDAKLPVWTAQSLFNEQAFAQVNGDHFNVEFLPTCSHPAMGRNYLVGKFLKSDADRLVFLDSDVTFKPGSILKVAHHPVDLVGGAYRYKFTNEDYPVMWLDQKELWADKNGLLEVKGVPGGFLSLSRNVFERLKSAHPDREYEWCGHRLWAYFSMPFQDGIFYGEDIFLCHEWRALGEKVYLDPELELIHWDFNKPYPGHIGTWLKRTNGLLPKAKQEGTI